MTAETEGGDARDTVPGGFMLGRGRVIYGCIWPERHSKRANIGAAAGRRRRRRRRLQYTVARRGGGQPPNRF